MEQGSYKKYLSIGFIVLFSTLLINTILSVIPFGHDSIIWKICGWWYVLSCIIQIAIVIYLCFYPPCKPSVVSKVGGCLYVLLLLISFVNQISFNLTGYSLIYSSSGIFDCLKALFLYTPGLLLFYWGSKLWLPVKILMTVNVVIDLARIMILWTQIVPMYKNIKEYSIKQIELLQNGFNITGCIPFFLILASLILTIVWYNKKTMVQIYNNQTLETI